MFALCTAGDLLAAAGTGVVERELHHPAGAELRDRLDRDAGVVANVRAACALDRGGHLAGAQRAALELDPGVQILGVLAHDHEVDGRIGVARAHARVDLARPHLGVHVELLAERHVDRSESGADRRRDRPLDGHAVLPDRVEHVIGERIPAESVHHIGARILDVPFNPDTGCVDHSAGSFSDLGPGSISGYQGDSMTHVKTPTRLRVAGRAILARTLGLGRSRKSTHGHGGGSRMADKGGLEGVVVARSRLCSIDGQNGVLIYGGYDVGDLAEHSTYEEVCFLIAARASAHRAPSWRRSPPTWPTPASSRRRPPRSSTCWPITPSRWRCCAPPCRRTRSTIPTRLPTARTRTSPRPPA